VVFDVAVAPPGPLIVIPPYVLPILWVAEQVLADILGRQQELSLSIEVKQQWQPAF